MARAGARGIVVATMLACGILASGADPSPARAQDRSAYMIRLLQTSDSFRVRAQAALSLGRVESSSTVVDALTRALRDDHESVRAAAAASLEALGDPSALGALRAVRRDRDSVVRAAVQRAIRSLERVARTRPTSTGGSSDGGATTPSGPPRFYVGVGMPGTKVQSIDRRRLEQLRGQIAATVRSMDGVVLAPERESQSQATQAIRRQNLTGYYLDASVVSIEPSGGGVRAVVSVILNTYPGRDMRAALRGAATVPNGTGAAAEQQALEGAVRGALRSLPQAMAASRR